MVRWLRWHCPPDTGFEIRALAVWGRARYLSVTEAPHNTNFHTWMGKKQFCFFQTAETGNRTPDSGVKGSGANHYPRAPALLDVETVLFQCITFNFWNTRSNLTKFSGQSPQWLRMVCAKLNVKRLRIDWDINEKRSAGVVTTLAQCFALLTFEVLN